MTDTVNNGIPFVPENTTDPAAGLNLSLLTIDMLLHLAVESIGYNTPPATVLDGARYIVGTSPTGSWTGYSNKLAMWIDNPGYWQFRDAYFCLNKSDNKLYYLNSTWQVYATTDRPALGNVINETTTARTLLITDNLNYLLCSNAAGCAITVPPQSSVAWPADAEINGRGSAGAVTFTAGSGVTITTSTGFTLGAIAGAGWTLKRESENNWALICGQLTS